MIMTDGIFMATMPKHIVASTTLGGWEVKKHDHLFIIQPGLYFLPEDIKTRGVPHGRIVDLQDEFRERADEFNRTMRMPKPVSVPVENFITMRQALARRKWHIAGTWEKTSKAISFDWSSKRLETGVLREKGTGIIRTLPIVSSVDIASVPYSKIIGGGIGDQIQKSPFERNELEPSLDEKERIDEQPDWVQPLF